MIFLTRYKKVLHCIILIIFSVNGLYATHIIGGEISYECLGNNQFRITVKVYRDCLLGQAPYDNPLTVSVFNAQNQFVQNIQIAFPGSVILPAVASNECIEVTGNVCVEEAIYSTVVTLPPNAGGYTLSYQRCCRNNTIVNLVNPQSTGATYTINIPGSAFNDCNSSPEFDNFPPVLLCANEPLVFDHSATDIDGDSLVYSFCAPFEGGTTNAPMPVPASPPPYNNVIFSNPYSATYPIASNPAFSIDPSSGLLTGTPTQTGQYVVGICVSEYRNGALLSTNKRDFQFNIVPCIYNVTALFTSPVIEVDPEEGFCNGLEVQFINQSQNATSFYWDFGVPGTNDDISTLVNPVFTYPDTGTYTIMLVANPDLPCSDTVYTSVSLYRELIVNIVDVSPQCIIGNSFNFGIDNEVPANAQFLWTFGDFASINESTLPEPSNVVFNQAGDFWVYCEIVTPYCDNRDSVLVTVFPALDADVILPPGIGCQPYGVLFTDNSVTSQGATYFWTFGDGNTSSLPSPYHIYTQPGIYDVSVKIVNNFGCVDSATLFFPGLITVLPSPTAGIAADPLRQNILTPYINFTDLSEGAIGCTLLPGDGMVLQSCNVNYTYSDTGFFNVQLIAINEVGCRDTARIKIKIDPNFSFYVPNAFTPNGDNVNDFFSAKGEGIKQYEMLIFNRWGNVVWRATDLEQQWDGLTNRGRDEAPVDIYVYKVNLTNVFGETKVYIGKVALIR
jgi:gliding motility-associated-like protein